MNWKTIAISFGLLLSLACDTRQNIKKFCSDSIEDCKGPATADTTRQAFLAHEKVRGDCLDGPCYGLDKEFVLSERWKNYQRYAKYFPRVEDTVEVALHKTNDTGEWVITLQDSDGRRASLWLKNSGPSGGQVSAVVGD